jgi:ABC-type glycerol-3-phosphate transport system permease component
MMLNRPTNGMIRPMGLSRRGKRLLATAVTLALLGVGAVFFITPFLWMISTSVKPLGLVYRWPPIWIPPQPQWNWYVETWVDGGFWRYYSNTFIIIFLNEIGILLSCSMVAFAFARLRFRGRGPLFLAVLACMMLPGQVTLIPHYLLFTWLKWVNTWKPLIVPSYFAGSSFIIFLMRQYFMTIPLEMDDAARIDGVGVPGLYWRLILPLARPVLGVAAILRFTSDWNDFFYPLIYLNSPKLFNVAIGLQFLHQPLGFRSDIQAVMAMAVVSVIPPVILFFLAQNYFVQGIVMTGVKG